MNRSELNALLGNVKRSSEVSPHLAFLDGVRDGFLLGLSVGVFVGLIIGWLW